MAALRKEFLVKLRQYVFLITSRILDSDSECASWTPSGFKISNRTLFLENYKNLFNNITDWNQFASLLLDYGFTATSASEFSHPQFSSINSPSQTPTTEIETSDKLHDINENQAAMMNQIETMYHDMEEMARALKYLKSQSEAFDNLVRDYNRRSAAAAAKRHHPYSRSSNGSPPDGGGGIAPVRPSTNQ